MAHTPRSSPIKARRLALIAVLLLLASLTVTGLFNLKTQNINEHAHENWHRFKAEVSFKGRLISSLYEHLGYDGMIHNFKNAVLRLDRRYLQQAYQDADAVLNLADLYLRSAGNSNEEEQALLSIKASVQQYMERIDLVDRLIVEGATSTEIDRRVKIDDRPSMQAMETLRTSWLNSFVEAEENLENMFHSYLELADYSLYALPAYLLLTLVVIGIFMRLIKSLQHSHDRLRQSEERALAIINYSAEAIITIDENGLIETYNPAANELFGYNHEEVRGRNVSMLMPEQWRHKLKISLQSIKTEVYNVSGQVRETEGQHKDGRCFRLEITIAKLPINDRPHYLGICRDITQRKQIEEERKASHEKAEQARRTAEQANQAKSQFLSRMSHELRTPLNAILGFSQLLRIDPKEPLNRAQLQRVSEIEHAGQHLLELVDEVLDLAKIETGHLGLTLETFSLTKLIQDCQSLITPMLSKHQLSLEVCAEHCRDTNVECDYTRLKQVLLNLLSNACKYNRENGKVVIHCQPTDGNALRISVSDNGHGVSPEQKKQLFSAFERLGAEQTDIEGTGIGLVISKQLIEHMGGKIGVESQFGLGSTFWIELPAQVVGTETKQMEAPAEIIVEPPPAHEREIHTLLYVEDNPVNLSLIRQLLDTRTGYRLTSATEPAKGLELAVSKRPDLIMLDLNLPGMDGYQLLRRLKQQGDTHEIPVIAISANALPGDIEHAKTAGFDDYLTKPIDAETLFRTLDKYFNPSS